MSTTTKAAPVLAELNGDGDRVNITFDYAPDRVTRVKKVPSAKFVPEKKGGPLWRLNLDIQTMRRLREVFGDDLELGSKLKKWGQQEVAKEKDLTDLSQADDAKLDNVPQRMVRGCKQNGSQFKLRPYQKADIKFMASTNAINANQPRTGKTIETIGAMFEANMEWGWHLVFAPVSSLRNIWQDQIRDAYACAGYDEPTILTGDSPGERREAIAEAKKLADKKEAFWLVLNPAMARMKRQKVEGTEGDDIEFEEVLTCPELVEIEWDSVTIDEFHLMGLSNPTTLGAKGVNFIAEATQPDKRFALSGTPMGGKPVKLWGALHFLEPDKFTSRWNWARHWLVINHNGYGSSIEGIMPGREVAFYDHLKPYLVRRTSREALPGLPPRQVVDVWCSMTDKQREQYIMFETEAEWALEDKEEEGRLTATNILAMYTRLKQFASAYCEVSKTGKENALGLPELEVKATNESGKLEQLIQKLEEENVITTSDDDDDPKCAVIFSQFNGMVNMVVEALESRGVPTAKITGSVTGKKRDQVVRSFQEQGEGAPRVIVANTMAGGAAITLDRAETVHLLDETWVPDNQEQAENRITPTTKERMERENIGIYYYRTRGSIEEYIRKLVADKQLNNKTILDLRRRMQKQLAEAESKAGDDVE